MNTVDFAFDPWGPISSILYEINDSDFVQNAVANTGVPIDWHPFSRADAYSHSTRIRALRRDISAAYAALDQERKGLFAQIIVKALVQRPEGNEIRRKLLDRLADIGWTISESGILTTQDALISEQFFPPNSEYDAYVAIRDILATATSEITIVDAYVGSSLLLTLQSLALPAIEVKVLTVEKNLKPDFRIELAAFTSQFVDTSITVRTATDFHDRFISIDQVAFYHVGASIKDAGKRAFMISHIEDPPNVENVRQVIEKAWASGIPFNP